MGIETENWPATVGLFTGLFAKEVIVGTLNSLYSQDTAIAEAKAATAAEGAAAGEEEAFSLQAGIVEAFTALGESLTGVFSSLSTTLGLDMIGQDETHTAELVEAESSIFRNMRSQFNPFSAYAYLLFVLIYFPCVAAFGTAIQEMGWKYGVIQAAYLTILAWSTATLFYQITVARNPLFIALPLLVMGGLIIFLRLYGRRKTVEA
jgi:ferrous iron transport protein B